MKLIVGLGNPGDEYRNTFHNLGYMCADRLAQLLSAEFSKEKFRALIAETAVGGEKVIIAKPLTYMNLSGESVREICAFYKIPPKDILVFFDDFDLNKGQVRIREKGSAGTHNGMRNIIKLLGTEDFARIRVGFKPTGICNVPLMDLVLSGIKEEDRPLFSSAVDLAARAGKEFAEGKPVSAISSEYGKRSAQ